MDRKTVILIIIILFAIYIGYKMRTEHMTKEQEDALTCKWKDNNGVVRNPEAKECYECYECVNKNSGKTIIRLKDTCITTKGNDEERQQNFVKYSDYKKCELN